MDHGKISGEIAEGLIELQINTYIESQRLDQIIQG